MQKHFIPRKTDRRFVPLSFAQERLWFLNQLEPESSAYNTATALRLDGTLDIGALRSALDAIVERHEVLRTTYVVDESRNPIQQISRAQAVELAIIDLTECPQSERDGRVQRTIADLTERPFDLRRDLMLRAGLLRLVLDQHVLVVVVHHVASDGWSSGILWRELAVFYKAFLARKTVSLPELPIQYADYAVWQRESMSGEILTSQLDYWKKQLQDLPTLQLPTDRPRPAVQSYRGGQRAFKLSRELTQRLKRLSRDEGVTLFMTLLAAFQTLLSRYSGQEDICTGSPIANRNYMEIEGLIGFFVNTLVLRSDLSGKLTFRELLSQVKRTALDAYAHQDLPFEKLVEELQPERSLGMSPLFQVIFALQNYPRNDFAVPELAVSPMIIHQSAAKFDLSLALTETTDGFEGKLVYSTDLFDLTTVSRMTCHFQTLLEGIVDNPELRINDLPLLTEAEKHQLLVEWNDTKRDYPSDKCIHQLFEGQVERTPEATAVVFEDQQLTYRELNNRANQLAHYLQKLGVGPEVLVGICLERSIEMVVGLLGILKAGGVYVPLDPSYPRERLGFMLQDSGSPVLITHQALVDVFVGHTGKIISLDTEWGKIAQGNKGNLVLETSSSSLAYVIYTSGSTGQPKGVAVSHRAVNRLVINTDYVEVTPADVMAQASNVSFDAATFEIWGALLNGARLVLTTKDTLLSPRSLSTAIERYGITTLFLTTALFNQMVEQIPAALGKLRNLLFGGEAVDPQRVKELLRNGPPRRLLHVYGPTETTTFASWYWVRDVAENATTVPIGRPIANTEIYILDPQLNPVAVGIVGELHIGGDGLAREYLNCPELTSERFIKHPFSNDPQARLYKTGDWGRYLADGNIEFVGRTDDQVKIRGFRIEPGEIEAMLSQHPAIREVVVSVREGNLGDKRLIAYIVSTQQLRPTNNELKNYLKEKLPEYMVPSAFVMLESLPLTPNGKVDRRALPAVDSVQDNKFDIGVAPRTVSEGVLSEIWAEILKVERVGIQENFFDLGGHSLLGSRLVEKVCQEFQIEFPLRWLFECPTVESMAARVAATRADTFLDRREKSTWRYLFELKRGKSRQPVFFLPGGFGEDYEFLVYARLVHYTGDDHGFYGLRPHSTDGIDQAHTSVEKMAADYLREMHVLQPDGPYFLIGNCIGGIIAYEIARQLEAQGQKVALLVLMDTWRPSVWSYLRYRAHRLRRKINDQFFSRADFLGLHDNYYVARGIHHSKRLWELPWKEKVPYLVRKTGVAIDESPNLFSSLVTTPFETGCDDVREGYVDTLRRYRPRPYQGRVVMLNNETVGRNDLTLGWKNFIRGGIDVHTIPGNHEAYIRQYVRIAGEKLRECLDNASSENSSSRSPTGHKADVEFEPKSAARLDT